MIKIGFTKDAEKRAQIVENVPDEKKSILERLKKHSNVLKDE